MAKPPRQKHSRGPSKPVTIELSAEPAAEEKAEVEPAANPGTAAPFEEPPVAIEEPADREDVGEERPSPVFEAEPSDRADPTPMPDSTPAPPPQPPRRASAFTGGLVGGIAALLLGGLAQWAGLIPSPASDPLDAVSQTAFDTLSQRVDALSAADNAVDTSALESVPAMQDQVNGLSQKVTALETLADRITKLEARPVSTGGATTGSAAMDSEIASIREEIAALSTDLAEIRTAATAADDRTTTLSTDAGTLSDRVSALESRASAGGPGLDIAGPIAAAALKSAMDRGGPFASELETYAKVTKDTETVEKLRGFAATGVPTSTQLLAEFSAVADTIITTTAAPSESSGFVDRLMTSAKGLVKVRPIGDVEGTSPEAIVARIEARLQRGDLEAAMTELKTLPLAGLETAKDFSARLQARIDANRLIGDKLNAALGAAGN